MAVSIGSSGFDAVGEVLEVAERLAGAADEAAGLLGLHVEEETAVVEGSLLDGGSEAEVGEEFGEDGFGFSGHGGMGKEKGKR